MFSFVGFVVFIRLGGFLKKLKFFFVVTDFGHRRRRFFVLFNFNFFPFNFFFGHLLFKSKFLTKLIKFKFICEQQQFRLQRKFKQFFIRRKQYVQFPPLTRFI